MHEIPLNMLTADSKFEEIVEIISFLNELLQFGNFYWLFVKLYKYTLQNTKISLINQYFLKIDCQFNQSLFNQSLFLQ